uniref:Parafibromin n=1 Tax=Peronospora matthiolae TaxID=2874970 RepID=A0AAV1T035_9STRA
MALATITPVAALRALRAHVIAGKPVAVEDKALVFLDASGAELQRLDKHSATAYHSKKLDKSYDLLAVYTCFQYAGLSFSDYVLKCREEKAAMVSTVDKKELVAYLKGDIDTSAQIVDTSDSGASTRPEAHVAAPLRADDSARALKRAKTGHEGQAPPVRAVQRQDKPMGASETQLKRLLAKEYVLRTRVTMLDAHRTTFDNVVKLLELVNAETKEKIEKAATKAASAEAMPAATSTRREQLPMHRLVKEKLLGTPIIVVPAGFSDLFTMLNAKEFLEEGVYVSNMQKKAEGVRKQQEMMVTHEEEGHVYTFKVVDTVSRFRDKDWRSVVGVIVSGQSWQFKGWKWKFPLEVFKKVCGVHIYNQGSQLNPEIKQWDVKVLMIHPDKRHLDKVAAKEFWRFLFAFMKVKLQ